ncbi:hypothetical protein [Spiroplasma endosymbiont of Zeiraphera isertana]|uniref:hypothetical protein n=1 Tax=Spiroplasma endosymbiont of Zeiraphera isertana TaxID=3066313 RepID=UPI00313C104F
MTKEIEQQIKNFTIQISQKLNKNEQEVLNKIINNYINLSKTLNEITNKHKKEH